jgi:hypothetical protein
MTLRNFVASENWSELIQTLPPKEVVRSMSFRGAMKLSCQLLFNEDWDSYLHNYAARLLETIRKMYPEDWNSSWEYDAFLGQAYDFTLLYDERFVVYKRVVERTSNPSPSLLYAFARCYLSPGTPPLSRSQAVHYLKLAIKDYLYADVVGFLSGVYSLKDDPEIYTYWKSLFESIKGSNIDTPCINPPFIRDPIGDDDFLRGAK